MKQLKAIKQKVKVVKTILLFIFSFLSNKKSANFCINLFVIKNQVLL